MKTIGRVDVPQEAFVAALSTDAAGTKPRNEQPVVHRGAADSCLADHRVYFGDQPCQRPAEIKVIDTEMSRASSVVAS